MHPKLCGCRRIMKLLRFKACLLAMNRGNGVSKITDCNGRCRNGWVFGQGFDSPQVHRKEYHEFTRGTLFFGHFGSSNSYSSKILGFLDRGARGPGDLGSAPTGAERRPTPLRSAIFLNTLKMYKKMDICLVIMMLDVI